VRARLPVKKKEKRSPPPHAFCEKKKHVEARTKRREGGTKARDFISFLPFSRVCLAGSLSFSANTKKHSDATEKTKHTKAYQHIQK